MKNQKNTKLGILLSTTTLLAASSATATITLVSETFGGTGAALNGTTAETFDAAITAAGGVNSWVASAQFTDNGGLAAVTGNSSAHISLGSYINDAKGASNGIFTLTATIGNVTGSWASIGFEQGPDTPLTSAHFLTNDGIGTIILRASGELDSFAGGDAVNAIDGPNGTLGARTLSAIIDLSTHNGTTDYGSVTWSDSVLGVVGNFDYLADEDFSFILLSEANSTTTTYSNLTLTQVDTIPEPGSVALLSLGALGMLRRRRN